MAILWPAEKEAVSHIVRAWKTRRNIELDGPKAFRKSVRRIFSVPGHSKFLQVYSSINKPVSGSKIVGKTEQKKL